MKKFLIECLASILGALIGIFFSWHSFISPIIDERIDSANRKAQYAHERLNSMFYEFADDCSWIDLTKEQAKLLLGKTISRRSDNREPEVIHLYGCFNYKDYEG